MRASIFVLILIGAVSGASLGVSRLARMGMQQGYAPEQPIAFSHALHAGENHVPCLYCHAGARSSRHAGIPSSSVCMNCHGLLEKRTAALERVIEAAQLDRPLVSWVKVHNLPDFVSFNHSRHVRSGVQCRSCHGAVEQMVRVEQVKPLTMGWCLECHREHAGVAPGALARAVSRLDGPQPAATGLDCSSCHY